jgi:hypothetical protein
MIRGPNLRFLGPSQDSLAVSRVGEGQRLRNDETQLYNVLQKDKIQQKVLLTGTPLQNNLRELFSLLQFLEPKEMNADALEGEFVTLTNENVPKPHSLIRLVMLDVGAKLSTSTTP